MAMLAGTDFSTSQFGGGGFLPSPANAGGQTTPGEKVIKQALQQRYKAWREIRDSQAQTLRSLTVKQLHDAIAADPTGDGDLDIDGAPVNNLTLVGKILDASEHASSTVLRVDDGTGIVSIKYWGDNDDEGGAAGDDGAAARRAAWQPGAYIRVHGNLRAFDGARSLVAFNVRPVADHNEITYHLAQCMLQHAHLSRASSGGATAIAANAAGGAAAAPAAAAKAENAAGGDPNAVGADGLTGAQREAKAQVAALGGGPQGAAVDDIVAALSGRVSEALVRDAVGFLLEEGHLYSTVDENHVKVA